MRVALDTNILAYAEGVNGGDRKSAALLILGGFQEEQIVVPIQALGELYAVLTRKARWPATRAREAVLGWHGAYVVIDTSSVVLLDALELATRHLLASWDAVILAAASHAGCRLLLSEDMQDGFTWRGTTIRNPFAAGP